VTATTSCDDAPVRHCGRQANDLLGFLSWSPQPPALPWDATPADRLAICSQYWANPLSYTPNPSQLTAPIHGPIWGYVNYVTTAPPTTFDGVRLDIPVELVGIRELFFTVEGATVDPLRRGPVWLQGFPTLGGQGVVTFVLQGPTASGHAALHVGLDEDPVLL
jgi:hypothetical protein